MLKTRSVKFIRMIYFMFVKLVSLFVFYLGYMRIVLRFMYWMKIKNSQDNVYVHEVEIFLKSYVQDMYCVASHKCTGDTRMYRAFPCSRICPKNGQIRSRDRALPCRRICQRYILHTELWWVSAQLVVRGMHTHKNYVVIVVSQH